MQQIVNVMNVPVNLCVFLNIFYMFTGLVRHWCFQKLSPPEECFILMHNNYNNNNDNNNREANAGLYIQKNSI